MIEQGQQNKLKRSNIVYDIIVVGGGAAGTMAAGQAAFMGARVLLLEKKERLGRKIEISGKGRCNLTNAEPIETFLQNYYENGKFLSGILREFDNEDLRNFFSRYGVDTKIERGGRVFPIKDDAKVITDALKTFLKDAGVNVKLQSTVTSVSSEEGIINGVYVNDYEFYPSKAVIISTGGASYPATGSAGDGFQLAKELGHSLVDPRPALIPLRTEETWVKDIQGLALRNVEASLWIEGKKKTLEFGEMLFTHFGVSGPIMLTLSRMAGDAVRNGMKVEVHIDLKPALTVEQLDLRVQRDFAKYSNKQFKNSLNDLIPKSLIPVIIELSTIDPDKEVHQISKSDRKNLVKLFKKLPLTIKGTLPLNAAIVTAGGVKLKEINPKTMGSKVVKGLYWAGEVVDIDGVTGGYNLQAAFSMGYRAGKAAADFVLSGV